MQCLSIFLLLFASVLFAEQLVNPPEVAALPAWPQDGELSPELAEKHVFRDETGGELVVSYPSPDDPTRRTTFKFGLASRVDPTVRLTMGLTSAGSYSYEYSVSNGENAKTPIRMWSIVGPLEDSTVQISHSAWRPSTGRMRTAPQASVPSLPNGTHLLWSNWEQPIRIGATKAGFRVVSRFLPGLTTAYAVGDGHLQIPSDLPAEVLSELQPFQQTRVMWRPVLTIGPRFSPDMTVEEIARAFRIDLDVIVRSGAIKGPSAYIRDLSERLSDFSATPALRLAVTRPAPGIEAEIARAIELAFAVSRKADP